MKLLVVLLLSMLCAVCCGGEKASERFYNYQAAKCTPKESKRVECSSSKSCHVYYGGCSAKETCCFSWKCWRNVCVPKKKKGPKVIKIKDNRCKQPMNADDLGKQCPEAPTPCSAHHECGIPKSCCWSRKCRRNICVPVGPVRG